MEIKKPNDMLSALISKPDLNIFDLSKSNIIPENTQLLSKDEYKASPKVQELFKSEDGKFNETSFNSAYQKAALLFNEIGNDKMLANSLEYDPYDFTSPKGSKSIDISPVITKDINPYKNLYSRTGINSVDIGDLSLRELAQQNKIYDTKENKWLDKSANDFGLFGSLVGPTLVYAQWDDDGESIDPASNRLVKHKKGDWKYNDDGNLYVETLGDREIYGKQVVNPMDLITTDNSSFNKMDFFDSDGRDKSVFGTTMKFATEIAPYLIPGFNVYYGGFKMALGLASVLPTFYKAGEGLFFGDTEKGDETSMWKAMNATQGFLAKYTQRSTSDKGSESMFNYEQMGGMVSDVFSQIYEQRAAASLSKLFYKSSEAEHLARLSGKAESILKEAKMADLVKGISRTEEQYNDLAKAAMEKMSSLTEITSKRSALAKHLNLSYMAMTQSADVYGEAIGAGYDNRTAGFAALLAATGQYGLMANNNMGNWFLDKTTGYNENVSKAGIKKVVRELYEEINSGVKLLDQNKDKGKNVLGNVFVKAKNRFKNLLLEPISESEFGENIVKHSLIEGVEEVTEQLAIDAAKGVVDIMSSLGFTKKQGSFGGFENVFSQKGLETYIANLLGGMIGGPLFELERSKITPFLTGKSTSLPTQYNMLQLVANGHAEAIYKEFDVQKAKYGSTELSPIAKDVDGVDIYMGAEGMSQADIISKVGKEYVKNLEKILNLENIKEDDDSVLRKAIIDVVKIQDLKEHGTDTFVLSDFTQLAQEIVDLRNELESFDEKTTEGSENKAKTLAKLKEKRDLMQEFLSGEKSEYYHKLSLFALNKNYHAPFISLSVDDYVKDKYDKDYYALTEAEKKVYDDELKMIKDNASGDFKVRIKTMFNQFLAKNEEFSKSLADYNNDGYAQLHSAFISKFRDKSHSKSLTNIYNDYKLLQYLNTTIDKAGFRTTSLDSNTDISLGTFLNDLGLINIGISLKEKSELLAARDAEIEKYLNLSQNPDETTEAFELRKNNAIEAVNTGTFNDPTISEINKRYTELLNKKRNLSDLTEEERSLFVQNIDKLGIPTTTLDYETLQTIFDEWNVARDFRINELQKNQISTAQSTDRSEDVVEKLTKIQEESELLSNLGSIHIAGFEKKAVNKNAVIKLLLDQSVGIIKNISDIVQEDGTINKVDLMAILDDAWGENAEDLDSASYKLVSDLLDFVENADDVITSEEFDPIMKGIMTNIESELTPDTTKFNEDLEEVYDPTIHSKEDYYIYTSGNAMISAKRALLIKYAQQVTELDDEAAKELILESNDILNAINSSSTKTLLTALSIDLDNYAEYGTKKNPDIDNALSALGYNEYLEIKEILESKPKKINTLLGKLNEIEINLWGKTGPVSMFALMKDNLDAFNNIISPSQFTRNGTQIEQLNKALYTIKTVRGVLSAMLTNEIDGTELYGMNVELNKAAEKFENIVGKFAIIDSTTAVVINKDLTIIEDKIKYLKKLAENNAGSLVEEQNKIKEALVGSLLKTMTDTSNNTSIVNLKFNGKTLISQDDLDRVNGLSTTEAKVIELESIVYNKFHADDRSTSEKLNEIFSQFISDEEDAKLRIINGRDTVLTKEMRNLEKKDWYYYLHSILALNSKDFYINYKNLIKNEVSLQDKKAPFYTQQFVHRQESAYFNGKLGKEIMAHSVEFLQPSVEELQKQFLEEDSSLSEKEAYVKAISEAEAFSIGYVFTVLGSAGTGKSTVLGNWPLRELLSSKVLGDTITVQALAPTEKTLNILSKNLGKELSVDLIKGDLNSNFFKDLLGDSFEEYNSQIDLIKEEKYDDLNDSFIKGSGDGAVYIKESWLSKVLDGKVVNGARVIFIDEMSKLTTLEWQILNYLAKHGEYYISALGDPLQNGIKLGKESFSMENVLTPRSIKLKSTIRAENEHQNNNNISLENFVDAEFRKQIVGETIEVLPPTLIYYDKTYLNGTKFINTLTSEDLLKLDQTKEIAFITESGELSDTQIKLVTDTLKIPKEAIKVFPMEVQGEEFDQVVILDKIEQTSSRFTNVRNLYTLLSRAKSATLIVGNNDLIKEFNINVQTAQYTNAKNFDSDAIDPFIKQRLEELESLTEGFTPTTTKQSKSKVSKITTFMTNVNEGDDLDEETKKSSEEEDLKTVVEKDKSKILAYSFYNNIGLKSVEEGIQQDQNFLNFEIGKDISLENLLYEHTGTDLGKILSILGEEAAQGRTISSVLNEYIKLKNTILFNTADGELATSYLLFNNKVKLNNLLTLKRLDTYSQSYKKHVNNKTVTGPIYVIGMNITIGGEDSFITLAVLPDINKKEVKQNVDFEKLTKIYTAIDSAPNNEISMNPDKVMHTYLGVQVPKPKDNANHYFKFSDIETQFPGAVLVDNEIKVFRGPTYSRGEHLTSEAYLTYIKDTMESYNTTKVNKPLEYYAKFAYRPYVVIKYGENLKYQKLIVLYGDKRSLNQTWEQLKSATDQLEIDKQNMTPEQYHKSENQLTKAALMSKYTGWRVLYDFLKYSYTQGKLDEISTLLKDMNGYKNAMHGYDQNSWPVEDAINGMLEIIKKSNGTASYSEVSKNAHLKSIVGDRFSGIIITKIYNPLFDIYEATLENSNINELFNKFKDEYSKDAANDIYYNTIIDSMGDSSKDSNFVGTLPQKLAPNYTMRYAIEPNKLLVNMDKILEVFEIPKKDQHDSDNKTDIDMGDAPIFPSQLIVTFEGQDFEINLDPDLGKNLTTEKEIADAKRSIENIWNQFFFSNGDSLIEEDGKLMLEAFDIGDDNEEINVVFYDGLVVDINSDGSKNLVIKSNSNLASRVGAPNKNIINQNNCKFK